MTADAGRSTLATFLRDNWNKALNSTQLAARKSFPSYGQNPLGSTFNDLVFHAFGSNDNLDEFVLCDAKINAFKARVWIGSAPMADRTFKDLLLKSLQGKLPSNQYLTGFKMVRLL